MFCKLQNCVIVDETSPYLKTLKPRGTRQMLELMQTSKRTIKP